MLTNRQYEIIVGALEERRDNLRTLGEAAGSEGDRAEQRKMLLAEIEIVGTINVLDLMRRDAEDVPLTDWEKELNV